MVLAVAVNQFGVDTSGRFGARQRETILWRGDRQVVIDVAVFAGVVLDGFNLENQRIDFADGDDLVQRGFKALPLQHPQRTNLSVNNAVAADDCEGVVVLDDITHQLVAALRDQKVKVLGADVVELAGTSKVGIINNVENLQLRLGGDRAVGVGGLLPVRDNQRQRVGVGGVEVENSVQRDAVVFGVDGTDATAKALTLFQWVSDLDDFADAGGKTFGTNAETNFFGFVAVAE